MAVSANLFDVMGARTLVGRFFDESEDQPNGERVAVISEDLWSTVFSRSDTVLGKSITVAGEKYTVTGVVRTGFAGPDLMRRQRKSRRS
jgi:hypothetical protein